MRRTISGHPQSTPTRAHLTMVGFGQAWIFLGVTRNMAREHRNPALVQRTTRAPARDAMRSSVSSECAGERGETRDHISLLSVVA